MNPILIFRWKQMKGFLKFRNNLIRLRRGPRLLWSISKASLIGKLLMPIKGLMSNWSRLMPRLGAVIRYRMIRRKRMKKCRIVIWSRLESWGMIMIILQIGSQFLKKGLRELWKIWKIAFCNIILFWFRRLRGELCYSLMILYLLL